jgi:ABC-2 type transport system ATP-binding protein
MQLLHHAGKEKVTMMNTNTVLKPTPPILAQLENVSKKYGTVTALNGISLSVHAGEVLALLGPNGAGKTTAVSLWLNLLQADAGTVTLFDQPASSRTARLRVGVMMQSAELPDTFKVSELIELTQSYYCKPRNRTELNAMSGIADLLQRPYGKLSGGQQRRVQFALAICAHIDILFLDEPTTGLDIEAREAMWRSIRALVASGVAVVLTTHYLEEAEALANRVVVIAQGQIVAEGSVDAIRARVAVRTISCVTSTRVETVRAWPAVESVVQKADALQIQTLHAEAVVRQLLDADANLSQLEIARAGLAEAFVQLTKEQ